MSQANKLNRPYDLIVWDWDGTIMDSTPTIVHCIQQACRDLGFKEPDDKLASSVIGLGIQDSLRRAVPWIEPIHFQKLTDRFRYHYLAKDHELDLFVGIRDLLEELHAEQYLLGVATGKSRVGLDRSLKHHQIGHLFHETRTADESFSKPHPGMLLELSDATQVPTRRMLMIGDTTHDLDMAANAGVDAVAVTYGAHPPDTLKSSPSLAHVDNVAQLSQWLKNNLQH
ncbi:HAD-IA family hydrolase [Polynucleobacter sp. MWH-Braz-FAM2G]|uniref:HAD-IA family hydrolase n=1 Tax=Polynucleobacter sp. MWH-Braz-FAM2G TaxID=1855883 RepID=UPI001BFCD959|nr:HAD-IA family hydrolase [Polynucleobacter sp. MWH-Braz-FAM2G]QWD91168.1 HAD-IA family hydrolase [Polynucleobacter sp. MWH-Braz-FAM2G]